MFMVLPVAQPNTRFGLALSLSSIILAAKSVTASLFG